MIFGLGPLELGIILVIALLIFGPSNLPKLGSTLGKTLKSVREGMDEATASYNAATKDPEPAEETSEPEADTEAAK